MRILNKLEKLKYRSLNFLIYGNYRYEPIEIYNKEDNFAFLKISYLNKFPIKNEIALMYVDTIAIGPEAKPYFYGCREVLEPEGLYKNTRYIGMFRTEDPQYILNVVGVRADLKEKYIKAMWYLERMLSRYPDHKDYKSKSSEIIQLAFEDMKFPAKL